MTVIIYLLFCKYEKYHKEPSGYFLYLKIYIEFKMYGLVVNIRKLLDVILSKIYSDGGDFPRTTVIGL